MDEPTLTATTKNTGERVVTINKTIGDNVDLEKGKCFSTIRDGIYAEYKYDRLVNLNNFTIKAFRRRDNSTWNPVSRDLHIQFYANDVNIIPCPDIVGPDIVGGRRKRLRTHKRTHHKTKSSAKSQKRSKKSSTRGR